MTRTLVGSMLLAAICLIVSILPSMASDSNTKISGTVPLIIFDVSSSAIGHDNAAISWKTNGGATSQVFYDSNSHPSPGDYECSSSLDNALVIIHIVQLSGLSASTIYHYRIQATAPLDGRNLLAVSADYSFKTQAQPPSGKPTTILIGAFPDPSEFSQTVYFTVLVISTDYRGIPTGTVNFYDGTTILGSSKLFIGLTGFSTHKLPVGSHNLTAVYSGDGKFAPSISNNWIQKVQYGTTTTLSSTPKTTTFGQSVTFTATVKVQSPGTVNPSGGEVTFYDSPNTIGIIGLSGSTAVLTYSSLLLGSHHIRAVYNGDSNYAGSTSNTINQAVYVAKTITSLTSSANSANPGDTVIFIASVMVVAPGAGTPPNTDTVTFMDGTKTLKTINLTAGQAQLSISTLSVGTHSISAVYSGDVNFARNTSNIVKQVINKK